MIEVAVDTLYGTIHIHVQELKAKVTCELRSMGKMGAVNRACGQTAHI